MAKSGELLIAYAWWEGLPNWTEIWGEWDPRWTGQINQWPANTEILTAWSIKNTGNEAATFKARLYGEATGTEKLLAPGDWFISKLPAISFDRGTHQLIFQIVADDSVVRQEAIKVVAGGMGWLPWALGGVAVVAVIAMARGRK